MSKRGNKYAQVFATRFGWYRGAFPLKTKSEAHEAVSILFARDGVPNTIVMDGVKEQTLGDFRRKCREASCHIKQTEPHSPWMDMAENGVRELKKASARQMLKAANLCTWKCQWQGEYKSDPRLKAIPSRIRRWCRGGILHECHGGEYVGTMPH